MKILKQGVMIFLIGFVMIAGMRAAEWVFPQPMQRLTICISENDKIFGNCKPFSDYIENKESGN